MDKIKIHKALVSSLVASSLIITSLAIQQTIASNTYTGTVKTHSLVSLVDSTTYSDEVELSSAPEYSERIIASKLKYKKIFEEKLVDRLKSIDSDKLSTIIDRIDKTIELTKKNPRLSLKKQEKMLAQLLTLKEIIEVQLGEEAEYSIDIDLESLLKI